MSSWTPTGGGSANVVCPNPSCAMYQVIVSVDMDFDPNNIGIDVICGTCGTIIVSAPPVEEPT
jgi:hypothetical protein